MLLLLPDLMLMPPELLPTLLSPPTAMDTATTTPLDSDLSTRDLLMPSLRQMLMLTTEPTDMALAMPLLPLLLSDLTPTPPELLPTLLSLPTAMDTATTTLLDTEDFIT